MKTITLRKLTTMGGFVLALTTAWDPAIAGDKAHAAGLNRAPMEPAAEAATGGFSAATRDAINARVAKAMAIAQRIRAAGPIDEANYVTLSQMLLGASDAGLDAAASALSYKGALAAIRAADAAGTHKASANAKTLGELSRDLVFYPITPCRLLDTRANGIRVVGGVPFGVDFDGGNPGNAAGCTWAGVATQIGGALGGGVSRAALALNVTVTQPLGPGFMAVRPVGSTNVTSNLNYGTNQTIPNMVVVQSTGAGGNEFELFSSNSTHVVVDVAGVFAPPAATALECNSHTATGPNIAWPPGELRYVIPPGCSAGYSRVSIACDYNGVSPIGLRLQEHGTNVCRWANESAITLTTADLEAIATCCRIPGR